MTTIQRLDITNPATGLLLFDFDKDSFWYYDGTIWNEIQSDKFSLISDLDGDTKIQVEESPDEDMIRFDLEGNEVVLFTKNANGDMVMQPIATSSNVIIGYNAG